jgi:uncharacterized protein YjbJ (UPF0337 family)
MGLGDKFRDAALRAKGKSKEVAGRITGNRKLEADGKADQAKAKLKRGARQIKDAIKDVFE